VSSDSERAPERKFLRVNADFPATVILPGYELVLSGTSLDVSRGGMRIATQTDLPPGQTIVLRFTLPGQESELLVRGRIVLSFFDASTRQFAHGVAFTQYSSHDQASIERYINETRKPDEIRGA
jgi:c-di-GMP-binding flagellar brake protein YcgR